jgi:hypothetical protein
LFDAMLRSSTVIYCLTAINNQKLQYTTFHIGEDTNKYRARCTLFTGFKIINMATLRISQVAYANY